MFDPFTFNVTVDLFGCVHLLPFVVRLPLLSASCLLACFLWFSQIYIYFCILFYALNWLPVTPVFFLLLSLDIAILIFNLS